MSGHSRRERRWLVLPTLALLFGATVWVICYLVLSFQEFEATADHEQRMIADQGVSARQLQIAKRWFTVLVIDPQGEPVKGAQVSLRGATASVCVQAPPTDETGKCSFARETVKTLDEPSLEVRAAGFQPRTERLSSENLTASRRPRVIALVPTTRVSITVTDETGQPVSRVTVFAIKRDELDVRTSESTETAVTGSAGECVFQGLPPGRWEFGVREAEIENSSRCGAAIRDGTSLALKLRTRSKATFIGQLLDDGGQPLAAAEVRWEIDTPRSSSATDLATTAKTDDQGWFRLPSAPLSVSTSLQVRTREGKRVVLTDVWLRNPGRSWTVCGVTPRDPSRRASISGRVTDDQGNGLVASVSVLADVGGRGIYDVDPAGPLVTSVASSDDGRFEITDLEPGAYWLRARLRDQGSATFGPRSPHADLRVPSVPRSGIELRLASGATISGTVRTEDGKPIAGLMICARLSLPEGTPDTNSVGTREATSTTDREGRFVFVDLARGCFTIRATSGVESEIPLLDGADNVASGSSGVQLRVQRSSVLRGTVRSVTGRPASAVRVRALAKDRSEPARETTTSRDGTFKISGLLQEAGYVLAVIFADGTASEPLEVWTPRKEPVVVMIDGGREITASICLPDGSPAAGRRFWLRNRLLGTAQVVESDSRGNIVAFRVADADFDLEPYSAGMSESRSLGVVHPGIPAKLVLSPERQGSGEAKGR